MEAGQGRLKAADRRHLVLLLGVVLAVWAPRLQGPIDLRSDGAVYYVLGTSLAEGQGYRLLNEPGQPKAVQYPPGLPLLVATVQTVMGTSDSVRVGQALRLLFLVFCLAYVVASYVLARQFLPPGFSLLVGLLVALHHETLYLSDLLFTEIPFGLLTLLFVLSARSGPTLATAGLGAVGFLLRSSGLALLAAWVGDAVLRRQPRQAVLRLALAALPVLAWQGYVHQVVRSPEYREPAYEYQRAPYQFYNVPYAENLSLVDPFRPEEGHITPAQLISRVLRNAVVMPAHFGDAASIPGGYWRMFFHLRGWGTVPVHVMRFLLGVLVLVGLALLARRGSWLIPLIVAGSAALVSVTPWASQFGRYIAPLIPLLALGLGAALAEARIRASRPIQAGLAVVMGSVLFLQLLTIGTVFVTRYRPAEWADRSGSRAAMRLFYYYPARTSFDEALDWLAPRSRPSDILASAEPHGAYLRIGRRGVMPPMEADPAEAQRLLDSVPVDYLVIDEGHTLDIAARYAQPAVRENPRRWELVYDRIVRIYRRHEPSRGR